MISELQGKYRFLSNFWITPVVYDGCIYPSVEHAYQAAKTFDIETRDRFMNLRLKPGEAKRMGRRVVIRPDWDSVKLGVMLELVRQKFSSDPLRAQLLETGDQEIQEGNHWGDTFWGTVDGAGENHLGKILMKVREELRNEQ